MNGVSDFLDDSVESVVSVSSVFNYSSCAVRFDEGILTFDYISVSDFGLLFYISGVGIMNTVVESVFGISLEGKKKKI